MSFTVSFSPCRFRGTIAGMPNPFTKGLQEMEVPEPLAPAEWRAVARVLKAPNKDFDSLNVEFPDGGRAEVSKYGIGQVECVSVRIGSLTPELSRFLIDLLKAANWMLMIDSSATLVVASEKIAKDLRKMWGQRSCATRRTNWAHSYLRDLRNGIRSETKSPTERDPQNKDDRKGNNSILTAAERSITVTHQGLVCAARTAALFGTVPAVNAPQAGPLNNR